MAYLRGRRTQNNGYTLSGDIALPPTMARNDIIGFEISRIFRSFDYPLVNPQMQALSALQALGITVAQPENPPTT